DVWAAGENSTVQHLTVQGWSSTTVPVAGGTYRTLWGSAPNDLWVGGPSGTVGHWDGTKWKTAATGAYQDPYAIAGAAANAGWALGQRGALLHWNGTAWSADPSLTSADLTGLWVGPTGDAWIVGPGVILRHR